MSVEIAFDTTEAQGKVDALGEALLGLADKAEQGSNGVKQKLSFGGDALKELQAMRAEMDSLKAGLKSFADQSGAAAGAQGTMRQQAAESAKTIVAQTQAVKGLQKTQQQATESLVASKDRERKAVADYAKGIEGAAELERRINLERKEDVTKYYGMAKEETRRYWQDVNMMMLDANGQRRQYSQQETEAYKIEAQKQLAIQKAAAVQLKAQIENDSGFRAIQMRQETAAYAEESSRRINMQRQAAQAEKLQLMNDSGMRKEMMHQETQAYAEDKQRTAQLAKQAAEVERNALATVGASLKSNISALDQYKQKVQALTSLRTSNIGNPSTGINATQYSAGLAAAKTEFDATSKAAARLAVGLKSVSGEFHIGNQASAAFRAGMQGAGVGFGIFTASTIAAGATVYGFTKAVADSLKVGSEFQYEFNKAAAVISGFGDKAGKGGPSVEAFKQQIIDLSLTSKYSAAEVAQAAKALGQAGQDASQAMATLPAVLNLATVGEISTEEAANKLVNTLAAFGLEANQASIVADKMTAASLASTTTIGELATGLGQVGATAHAAGIGLDVTLASLSLLRQVGISASKSGTDLRNIIQNLAKQTPAASAAFAKLHINLKDLYTGEGGSLDLIKTFTILQSKMGQLSKQDKLDFASTTFNKRSSGALLDFIDKMGGANDLLLTYLKRIKDAQGESARLAAIINDNAGTAFEQLKHSVEAVEIQAFTTYSGELTAKIKELSAYIQANAPEIAKNLASMMTVLLNVVDLIVRNAPLIAEVIAGFTGFKIATVLVRELAAGVIILEAAMKASAITAGENAVAMEANAVATAAAGSATAAAGSATATTAATIGKFAPLIAAVGIASYLAASKLIEVATAGEKVDHTVLDLTASFGKLILKQTEISKMSPEQLVSYFDKTRNAAATLATTAQAAGKAVEEMQKDKGAVGGFGTGDAGLFSGNSAPSVEEVTAAIQKQRAEVSLHQHALDAMLKAFIAIMAQTDVSAAGFDNMTRSLDSVFSAATAVVAFTGEGKMFGALTGDVGKGVSSLLDFVKATNSQIQVSAAARQAAEQHAKAEAGRATAVAESKARVNELTSELKNIIKAYGSEAGDVADVNRKLEQNNAIRAMIAASGSKMSEMMRAIGVSGEEAKKALDWSDKQAAIAAVSDILGKLDPRYKDLTKSMADANKAQLDGNSAYKLAEEAVSQMNLTDAQRIDVLRTLKDVTKEVGDGTIEQAAKMNTFMASTKSAWESFNTADTAAGKIASFGAAFTGATEEQKKNITISTQMAAVIKGLGTEYATSLDPTKAYAEAQASLNALEAQGIPIVGGYAAARKKLYETSPLGQLQKSNADLATEIELTKQGGDAWTIYAAALQSVGGNAALVTPELLAAAKQGVALQKELANVQQVQKAWDTLGNGIASTLGDAFTGGIKSFSDFKSKIKDMFRQLISELIAMAIKNAFLKLFDNSGSGGGGFWSSILSSFTGGGSGSSGGGSGSMVGSFINSALSTSGTGNSGWNMATQFGSQYGTGTVGSTGASNGGMGYLGNTMWGYAGQFANSSAGSFTAAAAPYAGALAGGLYGASRGDGGAGTLGSTTAGVIAGYYAGTVAASAIGYAAAAYGATAAAGAGTAAAATAGGAAAGASAGLAAIPIVGWVALIALIVDKVSGGKVFGTKYSPDHVTQEVKIGPEGATQKNTETDWKYQSQISQAFGRILTGGALLPSDWGKKDWRNIDLGADPAIQKVIDKVFENLQKTYLRAAVALKTTVLPVLESTFTTVQQYDKKGKPKGDPVTTSTVKGVQYKEDFAAFQTRINAEAIIDTIAAALPAIYKKINTATVNAPVVIPPATNGRIDESGVGIKPDESTTEAVQVAAQLTDEANRIADQWRSDAKKLAEGAEFLLNVATDMQRGEALLGNGSTLTGTTALIQSLQQGEETLSETYARVRGEVTLMDATLGPLGARLGKTREEYVIFSDELVSSLGGLQAAGQAMQDFFSLLGDDSKISSGKLAMEAMQKEIENQLGSLGLALDTSASQFADAFQKMLVNMSPAEAAEWLKVASSFAALNKMKAQLGDFMFGIEGSLADLTGRGYIHQLDDVARQMDSNIAQARALGASEEQLGEIRKLAAAQIASIIKKLTDDINATATQLYGKQTGDTRAMEDAHDQQMSNIAAVNQAQQDMYDAAQSAIKDIKALLKSLKTSDLAPTGDKGKMDAAQAQFQQTLQAALGGDPEAMGNLAGDAQTFLELAQKYFGTGVDYTAIFNSVTSALENAQHAFEQIPDPSPGTGDNGSSGSNGSSSSSTQDVALDAGQRYALALSLAQNIGQLSLATHTDITTLMKNFGINLQALARDLGVDINHWTTDTAPNLRTMAEALGVKVPELFTLLGGKADALAAAYHVTIADINAGNIANLKTLADDFGISVLDAAVAAGVPIANLLTGMGLDLTKLSTDTPAQLAAVATALGVSVLSLMGTAGLSMTDLVAAWNGGVAITSLDAATMASLSSLATILGVNIVDILNGLGTPIADIATAISSLLTTGIDSIPGLPDDIKTALAPFLTSIKDSANTEELNTNTSNLNDFVSNLPENIQKLLKPVLESVGIKIAGTGEATLDTLNATVGAGNADVANVALNTGEDGPIVRELKRINGTGTTTSAGQMNMVYNPSSAAVTTNGLEIPGAIEASKAMASAFFDFGFDPSDFHEPSAQPSNQHYAEDSAAVQTVHQTAQTKTAETTATATRQASETLGKLQKVMEAMHSMLHAQTQKIVSAQNSTTEEQERTRREARLTKGRK